MAIYGLHYLFLKSRRGAALPREEARPEESVRLQSKEITKAMQHPDFY